VATFLLSDEKQTSIVDVLQQISQWNADWKPKWFITDYHEWQINALESVFPGCNTTVYK